MQTLDDLDGRRVERVLVRSDLNVPLDARTAPDHRRRPDPGLAADAAGAAAARREGDRDRAHLGRPEGRARTPKYSLAPVAARLGELLGSQVALADGPGRRVGPRDRRRAAPTATSRCWRTSGSTPGETSKDAAERAALAAELAALGDAAFVSDGFGVVHRKQASVYDIAALLPHYAGRPGRAPRSRCCSS